ncbi:MAG: TRL domain-containing protein [Sumerlaeia bacterium]
MVKILSISALLSSMLFLQGCVFAPVAPPRGIIYNDQTSVLFPGGKPGEKEGRASSHSILFLVGWGDSGLNKAMADGDINQLMHTDYRIQNYGLIYQKYTTIARGE